MDDKPWFDSLVAKGDEDLYTGEGAYNDCFSGIGLEPANGRNQTTSAYVSAATAGGEEALAANSPPPFPPNKETAGNELMFWPTSFPAAALANSTGAAAAAYPPYLGSASLETRNHQQRHHHHNAAATAAAASWQAHESASAAAATAGVNQFSDYYLSFNDSLPSVGGGAAAPWDPSSMSVLGEPLESDQISPTTTFSSFSSSSASDAIGSLSLNGTTMHAARESGGGGGNPSDAWDYPTTISPKQLRINPSPTPHSSSESVHTTLMAAAADPDNSELGFDPHNYHHSHQQRTKHSSSGGKSRRELPNKPGKSRHSIPFSSRGTDLASPRPQQQQEEGLPRQHHHHHHHEAAHRNKLAELRPLPEGAMRLDPLDAPSSMLASHTPRRSDKDEYLIRSKEAGMTYREIRKQGGFSEAESTLRGRYRTLTKSKEARVRKPAWQEKDIHLLRRAVHELAKGKEFASAKIPWKEVAKYIVDHGGSYHFGNATCRKRWDDLVKDGKAF